MNPFTYTIESSFVSKAGTETLGNNNFVEKEVPRGKDSFLPLVIASQRASPRVQSCQVNELPLVSCLM